MHGQNRVEIEFKKLVPHQTTSEIPNSIIDGLHCLLALYFYEPAYLKLQKVVHLGKRMVKNESCTAIPHFKMIHTAFALKSKGNFHMSNFAFRS